MKTFTNTPLQTLQIVKNPGKSDVLFGRGGRTNNHYGNVRYRQLVLDNKPRYIEAPKNKKPAIAREIVSMWRNMSPPGRFLMPYSDERDDDANVKGSEPLLWIDVGDKRAQEKTSQCLREKPTGKKAAKLAAEVTDSSSQSSESEVSLAKKPKRKRSIDTDTMGSHESPPSIVLNVSSTKKAKLNESTFQTLSASSSLSEENLEANKTRENASNADLIVVDSHDKSTGLKDYSSLRSENSSSPSMFAPKNRLLQTILGENKIGNLGLQDPLNLTNATDSILARAVAAQQEVLYHQRLSAARANASSPLAHQFPFSPSSLVKAQALVDAHAHANALHTSYLTSLLPSSSPAALSNNDFLLTHANSFLIPPVSPNTALPPQSLILARQKLSQEKEIAAIEEAILLQAIQAKSKKISEERNKLITPPPSLDTNNNASVDTKTNRTHSARLLKMKKLHRVS